MNQRAFLQPFLLGLSLLLGPPSVVHAQPADCPRALAQPQGQLPIALDLQGLKGVPPGVSGQALITVPMSSGVDCPTPPQRPSRDVLRGPPGNVLLGR